ncbi:hypothetical protein QIS99_21065 [Streptomyces sp. B-S-A8]|uniref:Secreted protein n=1 Tax=Streptomyces solicavernae TaxID=3043614 RepID=A0ABT6RYD2_9ACTN|nr:hypothetical protein [Streptomyces sp. B-S-A8]MDI3388676.1 hypothetical protein [Streptomyces sp. B-S-A8]
MTRARAGIAWARSRRGAVTTASAAVVCLATLLAACGGDTSDGDDGYVALGAVGASPDRSPGRTVAPTGDVRMVPLDGAGGRGQGSESGGGAAPGGTESSAPEAATSGDLANPNPAPTPDHSAPTPADGDTPAPGAGGSTDPEPPAEEPESSSPAGPAVLETGEPVRKALADRWCEKVTVEFHNSGGTPVRSGTVTFGTHVIGGLGVDWATIESERKLPGPIGPGESVTESWRLCVDAWRVPLGMHIETQDVSVKWK